MFQIHKNGATMMDQENLLEAAKEVRVERTYYRTMTYKEIVQKLPT